jgi:PAS domain S-box-containing protein
MEYRRDDDGWQLASAAPVPGTPFLALVEFPRPQVLQGTMRVAGRFAAMSLVLLLVGWLGAWIISRDITRPIASLAAGADAIAAGDYSQRVETSGRKDELGALANAFNTMAANVDASVEQLANDISERKRAEAALRQADEMIRSMVQSSPLPIIAFDAEGRIKLWNRAAEQTFGWTAGEVIGSRTPTVNEEQRVEHNELRERAMKGEVFTGRSITRQSKDGKPANLKLSCAATFDAEGNATGVTAIFEDVTDSNKLEEQLRQAQKMEAVGRLAGGVAHDFNNLLTVVLGASDLLLLELQPNDPHRSVIGEIREAGERAAALTTQLLAFSRKQLVEPKVFVVNELVADVNKMLRRLIGEDIQVSMRLSPDLSAVEADRGQIEQVLVNLAVNARDAMPRGGALIIETANVTLAEDYVRSHTGVLAGEYVMLAVSDTGTGMSEDTKAHLFEPFFTTKEAGRGTGLGLATCYGIVRKAGGHIGVYSETGVGTAMKVYLPRAASKGDAAEVTAVAPVARGSETILVVEDDNAVRTITLRVLKAQGYNVLEAADGPSALAALESHQGPVQLLFTDVVLPGMGGREVAERVRALRPDMKILFTSGYTDDVILQNKLLEHNVLVLQKPFTPATLAAKVREILDAAVPVAG